MSGLTEFAREKEYCIRCNYDITFEGIIYVSDKPWCVKCYHKWSCTKEEENCGDWHK